MDDLAVPRLGNSNLLAFVPQTYRFSWVSLVHHPDFPGPRFAQAQKRSSLLLIHKVCCYRGLELMSLEEAFVFIHPLVNIQKAMENHHV